jgi:hypothetical protein
LRHFLTVEVSKKNALKTPNFFLFCFGFKAVESEKKNLNGFSSIIEKGFEK